MIAPRVNKNCLSNDIRQALEAPIFAKNSQKSYRNSTKKAQYTTSKVEKLPH